jgi:NADPH:quinone reductase-like Zn-dependent oxidoreductase
VRRALHRPGGPDLGSVRRMRAVTVPTPGGPDALVLAEVEPPEAGPGEVRIRVAAAGLNRADVSSDGATTTRPRVPPPTSGSR